MHIAAVPKFHRLPRRHPLISSVDAEARRARASRRTVEEIVSAVKKMENYVPKQKLWINPDCGLKTRGEKETVASLKNLVAAAKIVRNE